VLKNLGLLSFIKQQTNGLETILYPEGQHIPFTVTKRILLARAIVHEPRLLLLKDPLEHFTQKEAEDIIDYLIDEKQPWALIVSSRNSQWKKAIPQTIKLENKTIKIS